MQVTIKYIAGRSGLSVTTINKDIKDGNLTVQRLAGHSRGAIIVSDEAIEAWLVDSRQRCNGLTVESKQWLDEVHLPSADPSLKDDRT
jgi:hypothetical protein